MIGNRRILASDGARSAAANAGVVAAAVVPIAAFIGDGANTAAAAAILAGCTMWLAAATLPRWRYQLAPSRRRLVVATIATGVIFSAAAARLAFPLVGHDGDPDVGRIQLLQLLGYVAAAVIGIGIGGDRRRLARWAETFTYFGGAYAILALLQTEPIVGGALARPLGRFGGTFDNANAAGCAFGVVALISLAQLLALLRSTDLYQLRPIYLSRLAGAALTVLLTLGCCAMTQSRVAFGGSLLLGFSVILIHSRWAWYTWPLVAACGTALILALLWLAGVDAAWRFAGMREDIASRWEGYRHLARIVQEAPWIGHGLGSFGDVNVTHLSLPAVAVVWNWGAAHNILLHSMIEMGTIGTIGVLGAWGALLTPMLHRGGVAGGPRQRGVLVATLLILLCAVFDIALNVPALATVFSLLLGMLSAVAPLRPPSARQ